MKLTTHSRHFGEPHHTQETAVSTRFVHSGGLNFGWLCPGVVDPSTFHVFNNQGKCIHRSMQYWRLDAEVKLQ